MGVGTNCWGEEDADANGVLKAALDAGVEFFDTAEVYKNSEPVVGRAVQADGRSAIIATKYFPLPWHFNLESNLLAHLDESLRKLGKDQVDLFYIHMPVSLRSLETQAAALAKAAQLGKCRAVGVSNFSEQEMRKMHAALAAHGVPLAANQVEFSLLRRMPETIGLLAACRELGIACVAWCALGDGRICAQPEKRASLPLPVRVCAERVENVAQRLGRSPQQVALNWCMCKGTIPLAGTTKQKNMAGNAGAVGWRLSDDDIAELDAVALDDAGTFATKGVLGKVLEKVGQHG